MRKKINPWQSGMLATCALAAIFFASSLLWQQGHPQWAFVLSFSVVWVLISISWSNVDYAETSGSILANIVDHNFDQVHDRLEQLEKEVEQLRGNTADTYRKAS
jgi:hypothetical protein